MRFLVGSIGQKDYGEVVQVWEASVHATHDFLTEADIQYFKPLILNQYLDAVDLFCIKDQDAILGFLGVDDQKMEMLFVLPDATGRGVGKALAEYAIDHLNVCEVDVNEDNPNAVEFYKHMGFVVVSRSPLDNTGKPFPILHMKLKENYNSQKVTPSLP